MRAVVQRVSSASATVAGRQTGAIGAGLLVFLGVHGVDEHKDITWLADKVDLLHKSSASNFQLHVIDGGDQAEAETETLFPVSIPFAQNTEHFEFAKNMLNHNTFPR